MNTCTLAQFKTIAFLFIAAVMPNVSTGAETSGESHFLAFLPYFESTSDTIVGGYFPRVETEVLSAGATNCLEELDFIVTKVYKSGSEIDTSIKIQVSSVLVEFSDLGISRSEARSVKNKFESDQRQISHSQYENYFEMYNQNKLSERVFSQIRDMYRDMYASSSRSIECRIATSHNDALPLVRLGQEYLLYLKRNSSNGPETYSFPNLTPSAYTGLQLIEAKAYYESKQAGL